MGRARVTLLPLHQLRRLGDSGALIGQARSLALPWRGRGWNQSPRSTGADGGKDAEIEVLIQKEKNRTR